MVAVVRVQFQVRQRATETDPSVQQPGAVERGKALPRTGGAQGRVYVGVSGYVRSTYTYIVVVINTITIRFKRKLRILETKGNRDEEYVDWVGKENFLLAFFLGPLSRFSTSMPRIEENQTIRLITPRAVSPPPPADIVRRVRRTTNLYINDAFPKFINREVKQTLNLSRASPRASVCIFIISLRRPTDGCFDGNMLTMHAVVG